MLIDGLQHLKWGEVRLVDVAMAPGPLEASLAPTRDASELVAVRLDLPMGLVLVQESEPETDASPVVVEELLDGGSAREGGVLPGDVVRACSGCSMAMSYPAWQVMLGGVGRPTLQKVMVMCDGKPLEYVLGAVGSNSVESGGNGQVILLLERSSGVGESASRSDDP